MADELKKIDGILLKTINLFAAEYNEAKELEEKLNKISEEDAKQAVKDVNRALRALKWMSRAQWRASQSKNRLVKDINNLIKLLPSDKKREFESLLNKLKLADATLTKAASMFSGDLRKELLEIKTYEELRKKKGDEETQKLIPKLQQLISGTVEHVGEVKTWINGMLVILKSIGQAESELEKMVA